MPIYEYRCDLCKAKFSLFFKSVALVEEAHCTTCDSTNVTRLISSFGVLRSEESRMESISDQGWMGDIDESDPSSIARLAKRMRREMGDDFGPEMEEMAEQMASGQSLDDMGGDSFSEDF